MEFETIVSWLKDFGSIVGIVVTVAGAITGIIKPVRKRFVVWIRQVVNTGDQLKEMQELQDKQSKDMQELSNQIRNISKAIDEMSERTASHDAELDKKLSELIDLSGQLQEGTFYTLGNVIREVYHENKERRKLSEHDYDLCSKVYQLYHERWHQNGPIQAMWDEMQKWEKLFD